MVPSRKKLSRPPQSFHLVSVFPLLFPSNIWICGKTFWNLAHWLEKLCDFHHVWALSTLAPPASQSSGAFIHLIFEPCIQLPWIGLRIHVIVPVSKHHVSFHHVWFYLSKPNLIPWSCLRFNLDEAQNMFYLITVDAFGQANFNSCKPVIISYMIQSFQILMDGQNSHWGFSLVWIYHFSVINHQNHWGE